MKEKILLFDLDGTLIDSTQAILESFINASLFFGFSFKGREKEIEVLIGSPLREMFLKMGLPANEIEECIKLYRSNYQRIYLEKTFLLPKVKNSFKKLPNTYLLGVVTSKSSFFSKKILENLGMLDYFFRIIGIDDVHEPKPSAEPIFKALEGLRYDKNNVYMIGDTFFDMQAAKNAGIMGIGVQGKYDKSLREYTDYVFEDMQKALEYIKHKV
ncbi:HAD family hydrolase [Helicobacter cholecystus]|uniref:phosphoglycolate phosphatase n=1 Tax=Helicobacter cholecystus TaxID=45498 RepID=A0A3D8IW97_9HELI|nr:HAD family hydrolase [Helicobacter cholecystus]RDU69538.1 HAD family hydrolase [Helicobacter cholecystus]VEJ24093.1 HAD-superfamily hydrolase [Helicobacter cholecystus]